MIWWIIFAYCRAIEVFADKNLKFPYEGGIVVATPFSATTVTTGVVADLSVHVVVLDQYINSLCVKYKTANKRIKQKIYFNKFQGYRPASVSGSHFQNKQSSNG